MTIQTIGSASVALYLTPADLRERGLTPSGLTLERALEITRSAFQEAGILLDGSIEIEADPDTCGVLVFAHVRPPERVWYSFETLDALLDAAHALPAPAPDAALSWWEGRWWISLAGTQEQIANRLSEFGRAEAGQAYLDAVLAEHGRLIFSEGALDALRAHFPV